MKRLREEDTAPTTGKRFAVMTYGEHEWSGRAYLVTGATDAQVAILEAAAGKDLEKEFLPILRALVILGLVSIESVDDYDEDLGYKKALEEEKWADDIFPEESVQCVTSTGPVDGVVIFNI